MSVPATVVAATGGFVLGVAAFVLAARAAPPARRGRWRGGAGAWRPGGAGSTSQATRSFLVDVHLLEALNAIAAAP